MVQIWVRNTSNFKHKLQTNTQPQTNSQHKHQTIQTVFVQDGNPDKFEKGEINFFKRHLVGEIIQEIRVYQQKGYNLDRADAVVLWLSDQVRNKEKERKKRKETQRERERERKKQKKSLCFCFLYFSW